MCYANNPGVWAREGQAKSNSLAQIHTIQSNVLGAAQGFCNSCLNEQYLPSFTGTSAAQKGIFKIFAAFGGDLKLLFAKVSPEVCACLSYDTNLRQRARKSMMKVWWDLLYVAENTMCTWECGRGGHQRIPREIIDFQEKYLTDEPGNFEKNTN